MVPGKEEETSYMSNLINFKEGLVFGNDSRTSCHFAVYEHSLVIEDNCLITRKFIVLKNPKNQIIAFSNFHKYVKECKYKSALSISSDGNKRSYYICKFLNYIFFEKKYVKCLIDIEGYMIQEFLTAYGMSRLSGDERLRSKISVEKCVLSILDFLHLFVEKNPSCNFKISELYKTVKIRNKYGRIVDKKTPTFQVNYRTEPKEIFRDIPNTVFEILINHVMIEAPDLLILVALSAFGGLRPSEACNVRRTDSPLGPGLRFSLFNNEIQEISIDLKAERNMRSDLVLVGKIKKERIQRIYPAFLPIFYDCYKIYMKNIENRKYEAEYGPLTFNRDGKAMTYATYYSRFQKFIKNIIPDLLQNANSEVAAYGHLLLEHKISPHIFRHWFSVQLVLYGEDQAGLMYWRGDTSPESALRYLQWKGELVKKYKKINDRLYDFEKWRAAKIYDGCNNDD
jgi:integrase